LAERARSLAAEGWPVPVPVGGGATTVMIEGRLGRDRLMLQDGRLAARRAGESWDAAEVIELVRREPERFSPNVLLRPVIEAAILPTLAYAAGPGELAYLPQSDPIYRTLGVPAQARLPRWSARVIEARVQKVLQKHGLTADALGAESGRLEAELLREELPLEARESLAALREVAQREYLRLVRSAAEVDPTLQKPVESARNSTLAGIADVEKRLLSHVKKRGDITASQLARARTTLFPLGRPQERVLSTVSFLIRYGFGLVDAALAAAEEWAASLEPAPREA
ncbi:MAG: bacillithiol biosynthesis BshC, partial [Gemmatimonadetes bacterium]|nr:bacillithiol biosynthesis BshC [Gemmatimonadota bacterium]